MSAPVPLMTGTVLSRNPEILVSKGNPASYGKANDKDNRSSALADWKL